MKGVTKPHNQAENTPAENKPPQKFYNDPQEHASQNVPQKSAQKPSESAPAISESKNDKEMWCYDCSTKTDKNCWNTADVGAKICPSGICITMLTSNIIFRGCAEDYDMEGIPDQFLPSFVETVKCSDGSYCNNHEAIQEECYTYSYNTHKPSYGVSLNASIVSINCPKQLAKNGCFYSIGRGGTLLNAGCKVDMSRVADSTRITKYCSGNNCNGPSKFFTCLSHLKLDITEEFFTLSSIHELCEEDDKCYTHVDEKGNMERGCLSSASKTIQADCKSNEIKCLLCDDVTLCNYRPVVTALGNPKSGSSHIILSLSCFVASICVALFVRSF